MDFGKKFRTLTTLPFVVAVMLASALSPPTNVIQVNARGMGTEYAQPWRSKVLTGIARECREQLHRFKDTCASILGHPFTQPAVAGIAMIIAAVVLDPQQAAAFGAVAVMGKTDIKALRQVEIDCNTQIDELSASVTASGKPMTEEQRKQFADIRQRKADNSEFLKEAEAREAREKAADLAPDADSTAAAKAARGSGVQPGQLLSDVDPKRGFKSHNDQMTAIMVAGQTGKVDPRLVPLAAAGTDEQGGHTDPHGGFLLAPAFAPGILSVPAEVDPTAGLVLSVPMTNSRVVFNARVDKNHNTSVSGGLTVSRTPAAKAAAASKMEFEQVELVAHDLVGAAFATNRILRESPSSFIALMQAAFGDEFAAKKLDERLNGSGAGEFRGVISEDATVSVAKEVGQVADTIIFENVNKMVARCWRYGAAIWLVNHDALPQVTTLYAPVGDSGERVKIYAPGNEDAPYGTLLGRPIYPTEFCRTVGDKGDIVLANWSQYLEGNFGQMEEARSVHVRFLEREECFLFIEMNDAKPWWRSALTPKYSTPTLSPFVVLAAR